MVADDGTPLGYGSAKQAAMSASASDVGKKHNKKNKRVKQRSGKGYD
jgi:large subunit GTPase 1